MLVRERSVGTSAVLTGFVDFIIEKEQKGYIVSGVLACGGRFDPVSGALFFFVKVSGGVLSIPTKLPPFS